MKLSTWIEKSGGRRTVCKMLGVSPEALHYWLAGKATPQWTTIFKIVELSDGKVTPREIFEETKVNERFKKVSGRA